MGVAVRVFLSSRLSLCSDSDSETLKAAKVWKLAEVLLGEKQQCQDAKSQQKEQMVLLEKKSATYSQVCQGSGVACCIFYPDPRGTFGEAQVSDLPSFLPSFVYVLFLLPPGDSGASPLPGLAAEASSGAPAEDSV